MTKIQTQVSQIGSIEAIRSQLENLEKSIGDILEIGKSLPAGEMKEKLFYQLSCLDSIEDEMRQVLDSLGLLQ